MKKLPIPPFAIPIVIIFFVGWLLVLLFPEASLFGLSHHTWTGILFFGSVVACIVILVAGIRRQKSLNDKAGPPRTYLVAVPLLVMLLAFDKLVLVLCLLALASLFWAASRRKYHRGAQEYDNHGHE